MSRVRKMTAGTIALVALLAVPSAAHAATPAQGTLAPNAQGKGKLTWTGTMGAGTAGAGGTTDDCFDSNDKPDPLSGCEFFKLTVNTPAGFYDRFLGGVQVNISGFAPFDLDLAIYRLNADGSRGAQAGASGNFPGEPEITTMPDAKGSYIVALVPYAAPPGTSYQGVAAFNLRLAKPRLPALNRQLGPGPANYRASHDRFNSHSEPSIAMDPLNHNHLVAGSKMYESLPKYFFKTGTYESFNGGRTWKDWGQLPGYCTGIGQCNPNDDVHYRVVSDIAIAFDDEGNAYTNTLDAPGGATGTGWNQTINILHPGAKRWTDPIIVHDNRNNPISEQLLLDDKNWIAVDNVTDVNGAPNKQRDGKIGTIYVCWGLDGAQAPSQQIVLMRSLDGGQTWGGVAPGDNTPYQLSQKSAISGIGCHIIVGPTGEVYVTWYDNQVDALMQVKSIDRGHSFTPARPIAMITGVNTQFERQSFRNLSIPTSGVDKNGVVYVAATSQDGDGAPVLRETSPEKLKELRDQRRAEAEAAGVPPTGADIVLFKSTDGGNTYTGPVRVNQDGKKSDRDQFQPWMAVTPKGQVNIMYFDKRNDPNDFFLGEYLSRSNDGAKTFKDTRVDHQMWDPRINPPISPSGQFIGDYQGLAADDKVAIPFWNDTQGAALRKGTKGYSPWQEVYAARIPNDPAHGGPCQDLIAPKSSIPRDNVKVDANRHVSFHGAAKDAGCKGKLRDVRAAVALLKGGNKCQYLKENGSFTETRSCARRVLLGTTTTRKFPNGKRAWSFHSNGFLASGEYRVTAISRDLVGNVEKPGRGRNTVRFRVR